ncbi:ABC transporter permease [Candidatus Babeliales bacterium]|nr:ABC transporter permease [Candidatus Babeliales bacterium]
MNMMLLVQVALRSLFKHKTRSLLTTLGIIIGVTSIISIMSLGQGAKHRVGQEIEKLGTNFIVALSKPAKQRMIIGKKQFKQTTLDAIRYECENIASSSPALLQDVVATYEGESQRTSAIGILPCYFTIREWPLAKGRIFTESDVRGGKKVVILGKTVAKELFSDTEPINQTIRIKNIPFRIIGILDEKGANPAGQDEDDMVFLPITTMQRKIAGVINKFMAMIFSIKDKNDIDRTALQISSVIRQQHRLKPDDEDDFTIFTQDDISQAAQTTYVILNLLLFAVASIALVVGGIGIMNIMLVSVSERTQEIGIRMALGAQQHHILNQFLLEAIIICLMGGIIGVLLSVGLTGVISQIFSWPIFISKMAVVISLLSCIFIGLFFGYYPAYMASQLNPVDALAER